MGVGLSVTVAPAIPVLPLAPPLVALWGLVGEASFAAVGAGIVTVGVVFVAASMVAIGAAAGASLGRLMLATSLANRVG